MSPIGSIIQPLQASFLSPRFEDAKVYDAMRVGVISCAPDTPLREVARMMSTYHVHSIVVNEVGGGDGAPWGVVSDLDLALAAGRATEGATADEIARTELLTVDADETLKRATQQMAEHEISHLVVIQPQTGHPVGVLSTLDVAGVLAWGETT